MINIIMINIIMINIIKIIIFLIIGMNRTYFDQNKVRKKLVYDDFPILF
jgi:hypothetical protein